MNDTIKFNELALGTISTSSIIAHCLSDGILKQAAVHELAALISAQTGIAFEGTLAISDTPSEDGFYFASQTGTYTNAGSLVTDLSNGLNIIVVGGSQTTFDLVQVPLTQPTTNQVSVTNNSIAINGEGVYLNSEKTKNEVYNFILNEKGKEVFSIFNGTSSKVDLEQPLTLSATGDSIEFEFVLTDVSNFKGLSLVGEPGTSTSHIGFNTGRVLYVKDSSNNFLTTSGFQANLNEETKIKLVWTDTNIDVYRNDSFVESITKGNVVIENIGNAYSFFPGKIKNMTIISGGSTTEIPTPYFLPNPTDIEVEEIESLLTSEESRDISSNKSSISKLITPLAQESYSLFNGTDSSVTLNDEFILNQDGDFFEIEAAFYGSVFQEGLGLIGKPSNTNTFGFYNSSQIWFAANTEQTYNQISGLSGLDEFSVYKLLIDNGSYKVYRDEVLIGTFPKNNPYYITNIGNGYSFASSKIKVGRVKIHTASKTHEIQNLYYSNEQINNLELKLKNPDLSNFKRCYVSFDPVGDSGNEKFTAYVQNDANPYYYFGFEVGHKVNTDELVYSNQYRLDESQIYKFDGTEMTLSGLEALSDGESEFTYRTPGKADFTGGIHGDEQLVEVNFYLDGIRLTDLSTAFNLRPCSEFSYIQKSTMHETASDQGVVNSAHPLEAEHFKHTTFSNSGFITKSRIIGKKTGGLVMNVCYGSLINFSEDIGGFCQSSNYVINTMDQSDIRRLEEDNDNAHIWSESNGLSATVKSSFSTLNDTSEQFVFDRDSESKYYRNLASNGYITLGLDQVWEFETEVKFNKS